MFEPSSVVTVPGRVCLLGEHSDWAGGFRRFNKNLARGCCLVVGTNEAIFAEARANHSRFIIKSHDRPEGLNIPMTPTALLQVGKRRRPVVVSAT